jgi:hypothetical protein
MRFVDEYCSYSVNMTFGEYGAGHVLRGLKPLQDVKFNL